MLTKKLAGILSVALLGLAAATGAGHLEVSAAAATVAEQKITGITPLAEEERLEIEYGRPELETILEDLPDTLEVTVSGEKQQLPVTWTSVEDYTTTDSFYYQFDPVFPETYEVAEDVEIPYISVMLEEERGLSTLAVTSSENEETIFIFLIQELKLNQAAACGIMANIYAESGFKASTVGDKGTSHGICQWHAGRWTALENWCKKNGYDPDSLEGQLFYLKQEMAANDDTYLWNGKTIYNTMLEIANTAKGAYEAAAYWCKEYERPANKEAMAVTRGNLAKDTYWPEYKSYRPVGYLMSNIINKDGYVWVSWVSYEGADSYEVYRQIGTGDWTPVATIQDIRYEDHDVTAGETYSYSVQPLDAEGNALMDMNPAGITTVYVPVTKITGITDKAKGLQVKWKAAEGATAYRIYRCRPGETTWTKIATVKGATKYLDTSSELKNGYTYKYAVRVVRDTAVSTYSAEKKGVYLKRPTIVSAWNSGKKKVTVSWQKNSAADGYEVKYVTGKKEIIKKVKKASTLRKILRDLKKKTTYAIRIRTYKVKNGTTYYSAWSSAKKVYIWRY